MGRTTNVTCHLVRLARQHAIADKQMVGEPFGSPDKLHGMPMIRDGDNVYLINYDRIALKPFAYMKEQMELACLSSYDYTCPFSILREFDKWWEWHKRLRFDNERTGSIITTMLRDPAEIKRHKLDTWWFRVAADHYPTISNTAGYMKWCVP